MESQVRSFLQQLEEQPIEGLVYLPGEEGYEREIKGYNTAITHTPDVVIGAKNGHDILIITNLARQFGLPIKVQSTGHGALSPIKSGILITTKRMDHVSIDPTTCIATIGAGARWRQVSEAASKHKLSVIAGSSVDVGVVGYLLGGGIGPLARSHGFSSDYLVGLTVVTENGELLQANETENAELFWALRGGKIGLGIVTEVRLELSKLQKIYGGSLFFEEKDINTALSSWVQWTRTAHPDVTTSIAIVSYPDIPVIPLKFRGKRLLSLRFAYPGSIVDGERLAIPLRSIAPVYHDAISELDMSQIATIHNDPTDPMPFWCGTVLLNDMGGESVQHLLREFGAGKKPDFNAMEIRHIGSATRCDVEAGSAVGGRSAEYALGVVSRVADYLDDSYSKKADQLFNHLQPWICEEGNINFMEHSVPGRHFKGLWPEDISKKLDAIRKNYAAQE